MNAFVGYILFCCRASFHGNVAVVMAAYHGVWGFEKSDKISENPVFSRLPTFAPIITEESTRRTIPVAFMVFLSLCFIPGGIVCRKWWIMRVRQTDCVMHRWLVMYTICKLHGVGFGHGGLLSAEAENPQIPSDLRRICGYFHALRYELFCQCGSGVIRKKSWVENPEPRAFLADQENHWMLSYCLCKNSRQLCAFSGVVFSSVPKMKGFSRLAKRRIWV